MFFNYKDGFVRFWNPYSGWQITSKAIDDSVVDNKEENPKVFVF